MLLLLYIILKFEYSQKNYIFIINENNDLVTLEFQFFILSLYAYLFSSVNLFIFHNCLDPLQFIFGGFQLKHLIGTPCLRKILIPGDYAPIMLLYKFYIGCNVNRFTINQMHEQCIYQAHAQYTD